MCQRTVQLEISGPSAMWTRPDTGDAPVSYPAPTFGAVKGIFEAVLWLQSAEVVPAKAEICRPIVYHNYTTNYGGPLRKTKIMKGGGSSYQLIATVLIDVCYRLYACVCPRPDAYHGRTTNGPHAYQEMLEKRLARGQFFRIPCLGWSEFAPDYVGPFRPETRVCEDIAIPIPSMLKTRFPSGRGTEWQPTFDQNVRIEMGVLRYAQ